MSIALFFTNYTHALLLRLRANNAFGFLKLLYFHIPLLIAFTFMCEYVHTLTKVQFAANRIMKEKPNFIQKNFSNCSSIAIKHKICMPANLPKLVYPNLRLYACVCMKICGFPKT